jgi:hypothetical protein
MGISLPTRSGSNTLARIGVCSPLLARDELDVPSDSDNTAAFVAVETPNPFAVVRKI